MKRLLTIFTATGLALFALNAGAISIGWTDSPDRVLGTIDPSQPTSPADEAGMINYLLTQTSDGTGVTDGHNNSGILTVADNPDDSNAETYTLVSGATVPVPAPLATEVGSTKDEATPPDNTFTLVSAFDWLVAKYGQNSEVYYIGDLPAGTDIVLASSTSRFTSGNGLSHISLYNPTTVADGGATLVLLGLFTLGLSAIRRNRAAN